MSIALQDIAGNLTGLILAGGRGSRMGDVDKGLQTLHGKALAAHALERLAPQVQHLAINANRHQSDYAALGAAFSAPVWPDLLADFPGPLAGLHSGLTHCRTDYLVAVPCDSPLLPADLVARLVDGLLQDQADAAFAVTGPVTASQRRQSHPVFCLLKKTLLPALTHYLHHDGRKMERWFAGIHAVGVHFDDDAAFSNINTLDELRALAESASVSWNPNT